MTIANFEQLYEGLCEIADFKAPALGAEDDGTLAFTLSIRGVEVTAVQSDSVDAGVAYLMAELGPLPADDALPAWLALMTANRRMLGTGSGVFSCDPEADDPVLQLALPFARTSAVDAYVEVNRLVDRALDWRERWLRGGVDAQADEATVIWGVADVASEADPLFAHLRARIPTDLSIEVIALAGSPTVRLGVVVRFDTLSPLRANRAVLPLMKDNFASMASRHAAAFSRDPATGALLRQYVWSSDDPGLDDMVADITQSAQRVLQVNRECEGEIGGKGESQAPLRATGTPMPMTWNGRCDLT